jgi:hypothetical protein
MESNRDFNDLLRAFIDGNVEFLVVGAHALAVHDWPRATKHLDVWIDPTHENAQRTWDTLGIFGAPLDRLTVADLMGDDTVFHIGVAPIRFDIRTSISGVRFSEAWPNRAIVERDGMRVPHIGVHDYLRNKDAAGRDQDRVDAAAVRRRLAAHERDTTA